LLILLLVLTALHRGLGPHISGVMALLGRVIPLPFNMVALLAGHVAPFIYEIAFVTGLVPLLPGLVTLIRG
jgi:hypothetical protein